MSRKRRKGEYLCHCHAYKFPHRFGGGRCDGFWLVVEQWENNYGGGACHHCNSRDNHECDVYGGKENINECPVYQDFIRYNEIKIYYA